MRFGSLSTVLLLAFAAVAAVGLLMVAWGRGGEDVLVVYEANVPDWRWRGTSPPDQFLALLTSEEDARRAQAALPDSVWAQIGPQIDELLAEGDTAVVIAYLGEAPTGGYAIRVRRIAVHEPTAGTAERPVVTVTVARRQPTPDEFVIQIFTHPYDMVTIPKNRLPAEPFDVAFLDDEGNELDGGGIASVLQRLRRRLD